MKGLLALSSTRNSNGVHNVNIVCDWLKNALGKSLTNYSPVYISNHFKRLNSNLTSANDSFIYDIMYRAFLRGQN